MFIETKNNHRAIEYFLHLKNMLDLILLIVLCFISSCKKEKDYATQFLGNYNFTTIEISQTGSYCTDTIYFNGSISPNGSSKLKIIYKLSNSSPCNTLFENGIIYSDVDEHGNLTNSDFNSNSTDHFRGKIEANGKINLEVVQHYGQGGYYGTILNGMKF